MIICVFFFKILIVEEANLGSVAPRRRSDFQQKKPFIIRSCRDFLKLHQTGYGYPPDQISNNLREDLDSDTFGR